MDTLHKIGVESILKIQSSFAGWDDTLLLISHIGDPRFVFMTVFPLVYYLNSNIGIRVQFVASLADWLNVILKWLLHGERPYWWIHEGGLYEEIPKLQQWKLTCETGPGSPSGHAMITAAVWYVIVSEFAIFASKKFPNRSVINFVSWLFFAVLLFTVALSRVYIATHFPHQVLLGGTIGFVVGYLVNKIPLNSLVLKHYLTLALGLFVAALTVYYSLGLLGMDLTWSITKALRRCAKREYIHLDTTPFFSLIRDCASLIGLGFGLNTNIHSISQRTPSTPLMKGLCAVLALFCIYLADYFRLPQENILIFYCLAFVKHLIIPYFVVAIIPFVVSLFQQKTKEN